MTINRKTVLVLDDEEMITESISSYLELTTDYVVLEANNPKDALELIKENRVDLVLSDFLMPDMNGLEFLIEVRKLNKDATLILLTGYADKENAIKAINQVGLYYYIEKPWHNEELVKIINNGIEKKTLVDELRGKIAELEQSNTEKERLYQLLQSDYRQEMDNVETVIFSLARAIEAKDKYTEGHGERVSKIATALSKALNLPQEKIDLIRTASIIHDIGKIGVSEHILNKPGKLTSEEFEEIKKHPDIGVNICSPLNCLKDKLDIIKYHHEKVNGSGYPLGLHKENIPLEARIVSVADVFDALYSDRPYRPKLPFEQVVSIMKEESDKGHLDSDIVNILLSLLKKKEDYNKWV